MYLLLQHHQLPMLQHNQYNLVLYNLTELNPTLSLAVPLTSIFPLTQIIDSAIIIKGLKNINANGVSLYGLFSGVALTVVNLPVSLCYGLSAVAVPAISGGKEKSKTTGLIITTTFLVSLAFAIIAFLLPLAPA